MMIIKLRDNHPNPYQIPAESRLRTGERVFSRDMEKSAGWAKPPGNIGNEAIRVEDGRQEIPMGDE